MKKKLWITSLLAALSITAAAGGVALAKQDAIVTDAAETWTVGTIDNNYVYGTSFEVPGATVEIGGESVAATATVTYPNGLTVSTGEVQLNQSGVYTVTYRAVVGDTHCVKEEKFNVEAKGYLMQNSDSTAEYGHYSRFGANSDGLLVRLAPNDTLTFSQLIDVGSLTDPTMLFDIFVTPDTFGAYDFSKLVITLTDALDSSQFLRFQFRRYGAEDRGYGTSYLDVSVNGQPWVGFERDTYRFNNWGSPFQHTFSAAIHKGNGWTGDLVESPPDKSTCRLMYTPMTMETNVSGAHIAYLNDPTLFEEIWKGWPSGKARLTMTAEEVKSQTANFCIRSVYGIDLTQEMFAEGDAPIVTISRTEDEMPKGEVGRDYVIPSATAFDFYAGDCAVKTSVYRDYASANPVSVGVVDGKFKPTAAGWHTIVYKSYDALNNEAVETRNVYVEEDLGEIEIVLPDNLPTSATLGSLVTIPEITYTGDCGFATVKKSVTFGDETFDVEDEFRPEYSGDWVVTYTVVDYLGRTATASFTVNATPGNNYVLLDKLVLPRIFLSDCTYTIPELYATDYSTGAPVRKLCDVVVSDKNGDKTYQAGATFKPSVANNGDKVTISYQCSGTEVAAKEVPAVIVRLDADGKANAMNYIYGEDVTASYKAPNGEFYQAGVAVTAKETSEISGWTFATPQLMSNFKMIFEGIKSLTLFEGLKLTFTDSLNENEQISITLRKKGNGTTMTVCGESLDSATTTLAADKQYTVAYNAGKFNFAGMTLAATHTDNGEVFNGFSSSVAYITVEMINAQAGASYLVRTINETNLSRRNQEVFAPNFQILGVSGGNQSLNAVYELFPAIANDVLAPNVSLTMTVTAPDGSIAVDNDGVKLENVPTNKSYFITLSQYGKYQASYTAVEEDWVTSNPLNIVETIFVIDEQAPKVAFTNATQTTAKVGDVITLPTLVYQDNITTTENIRVVAGVFNPLGKYYRFEGDENAIRCAHEGDYRFIVMVFDEHGNMGSVTHTITVTK